MKCSYLTSCGVYIFLLTILMASVAYPITVTSFIPHFLLPGKPHESEVNGALPVNSLMSEKFGASGGNSENWYCKRGTADDANVFCQPTNSAALKMISYESTSHIKGDTNPTSTASTDFGQSTSANQNALEDVQVRNILDRPQGSFLLPIDPSSNVNMNVNPQQVEFNIKY